MDHRDQKETRGNRVLLALLANVALKGWKVSVAFLVLWVLLARMENPGY